MVVACALWGISCVQTWFYFDNYPADGLSLKAVALGVWLSDTVHQMLITQVSEQRSSWTRNLISTCIQPTPISFSTSETLQKRMKFSGASTLKSFSTR
ncbi:hypothetical protein BT96DRAFT_534144 [Gymnopus androsaceus JB14]|uniref:Uncharacterized protein n=1 Tax=Gymnopus androsaceus JB14 TaxID=1447944 RepID=A0A6A4IKT2_9AGAR|nr:hypothetical protein BT96DRAFT_534144 [Gymnopus androsaceus JB14]